MTPLSIRLAILEVLAQVKPYKLPQPQLLADVNRRVRPQLTLPELVKHLSWLKAQDMAGFSNDELAPNDPDARKWFIKEAGESAIGQ